MTKYWRCTIAVAVVTAGLLSADAFARSQGPQVRFGALVPIEVKTAYDLGLQYIVAQQGPGGDWPNSSKGGGPGIDGLCVLALLARGEDPNFGEYAVPIRKGLRSIIRRQVDDTGLIPKDESQQGGNMYHHGFATLALAEAYGLIDERTLWQRQSDGKSLGKALELAVQLIITAQNQNPYHGWRYSPTAQDADISVSGAAIVALLAAKNAGIEVPDVNIDQAMKLLQQATDKSGSVMYQFGQIGFMGMESTARSSIVCLSLAIAKRKETAAYQNTVKFLKLQAAQSTVNPSNPYYTRYYLAQALFQSDFAAWQEWNRTNTEMIQLQQQVNGAIGASVYETAMSLLSMGLNFRFLPIYER